MSKRDSLVWQIMKVPDNVFAQICAELEAAEQAGEFDRLFKGDCSAPDQEPDKSGFLQSLKIGMKLYKSTFLKIYGYELTYPGYAEKALSWLEMLGCSNARVYYSGVVVEYEHQQEKEMKGAAAWYRKFCEDRWERLKQEEVRKLRKQQEVEQLKADLQQKSDKELLILLQSLKQRKEENGGPFQIRGRLG